MKKIYFLNHKFRNALLFAFAIISQFGVSQSCDLFFSEYIEGSSNNKAIEIYNPTTSIINLTDYRIYRYNNGSPTPSDSLLMQGTLAPGAVYVAGNPSAVASITGVSDTLHTITFFNGDDAMELRYMPTGTALDIIGIIGIDPGTNWPVGTGATSEFTLVRKNTITSGNTNWGISSANEWDVYPQNTFTFIGSHTSVGCCSPTFSSVSVLGCLSYTSPSGNYTWTLSGIYSDTIPNANGCDSIITIDLSVTTFVDHTVGVSNATICAGDSVTINIASSETDAKYVLRDNSNNAILAGPISGTGAALNFNSGPLYSSATYNIQAQKYTGAVKTPNPSDYLEIDAPFFSYGTEITVEGWFNYDGSNFPTIGQATDGMDDMLTNSWIIAGGVVSINDNGTWKQLFFPFVNVPTGWMHVAVVGDANGIKIYYNDSLVASNTFGITSGIVNNPASIIRIGEDPRMPVGWHNNPLAIDNLMIWNVARSQSEISSDMNTCLSGTETGLVQYTKFNEGMGAVISSLTGDDVVLMNPSGNNWVPGSSVCDVVCDMQMTDVVSVVVNQPTSSSISTSACDTYTSPSGNFIWSASGIYADTIPNIAGCDSIITVNLTIINSTASSINVNTCFSYTVPSGAAIYTLSGTYNDTIPNINGCDSIITINLTINNVSTTGVTDNSPTLTADAVGATYQWLDCGNSMAILTGETNQSFTAAANGSYAVEVTENGCTDTSSCINISNVSVIENSFGDNIVLYPNPTTGMIKIEMGSLHNTLKLTLTNVLGQEVSNTILTNVDAFHLAIENEPGMYFIKLVAGDGKTALLKVIKE